MIKITDRINDIRETIVKEGFFKTLDKNQRQFWLSHKTLLTFLWIFLSIMVGEFIIYKHQDVFRSYAISASDLRGGESDCAALEPAVNREQYEKQVESSKNFYQNILSRYASENAAHDEVGDEIKKIMGQKRKNEVPTPVKMAVRPQQATAAFVNGAEKARIANVKKTFVHVVRTGENLTGISKKYFKTTSRYREIARANNISAPYSVKKGDRIVISME